MEKGPLGEFARLRQPQARQARPAGDGVGLARGLQTARQQQLQQHRPAVGLQFQHILARVGVRGRKPQRQPVVQGGAVRGQKRPVVGMAGPQLAAEQRRHQRGQPAPRQPHDAHRAAPGRGGDGGNRVLVPGQHPLT